jgi:hypothetical protein
MSEQPSRTCPVCKRVTYHPKDIEEGYCGFCHSWNQAGPTGNFPHGKLREDDEGEIKIAVTVSDNNLVIDFGPKGVTWIALDRRTAEAFIAGLTKRLEELVP